jgi:hypothetical protein
MRKISLFAVAAAVVATGLGVWAASTTNARVAPSMRDGIEAFVPPRQPQHGPGYESRNRCHNLQRAHRGPCIAGYARAAGERRMTVHDGP